LAITKVVFRYITQYLRLSTASQDLIVLLILSKKVDNACSKIEIRKDSEFLTLRVGGCIATPKLRQRINKLTIVQRL